MPNEKRPLKVFLCHAHADKAQARDLYRTLKRRGLQPWLDAEDLLPGQAWQVEIPKALETSDAIIILLSKTSVDKEGYVQKEIKFALDKALEMPEGRIFLIPARLEECQVPRSISGYHWVDLFDDRGYDKLMKALKLRAEQLERVNVKAFTKYKPEPEFEKTPLELLKREIRLKTSNLEKILDFLQNRLQKIYPAEKSRVVKLNNFPDGIKRTITHTYSLSIPYRGQNKLVMQCAPYATTFPGEFDTNAGETQEFHTYNAIVFTGWETQTVFLELEYDQKWQAEIDVLVKELYDLFGQYGGESVGKSQVGQPTPEKPVETQSEVVPEKKEPEKPVSPPPVVEKSPENPLRKLKPAYIVAIIGVAATILAALIGILPKIINRTPEPSHMSFTYQVRVETESGSPIAGAVVTLEIIGKAPIEGSTDSVGFARIFVDEPYVGQPARLDVKANGYQHYIQNIELAQDGLPKIIQLSTLDGSLTISSITPTSLPGEIIDAKGVSMHLVPAGQFIMGSSADDALAECQKYRSDCQRNTFLNEEPSHRVTLEAFYIDVYEVTNALYKTCVDSGTCTQPVITKSFTRDNYYGNSTYNDYPVIYVDWNQAKTYCEWRNARLPNEAEWEKAAGGTDGRNYPWGNTIDNEGRANYCDKNCSYGWAYKSYDDGYGDTAPVGSYEDGKSPYGLYDMAGNVWEWVADWYNAYPGNTASDSYYGTSYPIVRGGSWGNAPNELSVSYRGWYVSDQGYFTYGFRCARDAQP